LLDHYRIIYLDGIHFTVRHGTQTDATMIVTALGVDLEGSREVLAFRACAEEDKEGWSCLLQDLRNVMRAIPRREQQEVVAELTGIWKQETREQALLNLAAFKAKYQKRYPEAIRSLCEDEEHLLTFYAFPPIMHRYIRSTNAIESLFSNVRQRTDQIDAFTTETGCLTIVWAVMQDIRLPKIPVG
jgi:putative transposase